MARYTHLSLQTLVFLDQLGVTAQYTAPTTVIELGVPKHLIILDLACVESLINISWKLAVDSFSFLYIWKSN